MSINVSINGDIKRLSQLFQLHANVNKRTAEVVFG